LFAKRLELLRELVPNAATVAFRASNDPIGAGLAHSLARPGGTVTGLTILSKELSQKRLELFRETVPNLARVAVLINPTSRRLSLK
jgi:putative tryptophan/tyrosine transport system substrate-binding protein